MGVSIPKTQPLEEVGSDRLAERYGEAGVGVAVGVTVGVAVTTGVAVGVAVTTGVGVGVGVTVPVTRAGRL